MKLFTNLKQLAAGTFFLLVFTAYSHDDGLTPPVMKMITIADFVVSK